MHTLYADFCSAGQGASYVLATRDERIRELSDAIADQTSRRDADRRRHEDMLNDWERAVAQRDERIATLEASVGNCCWAAH